MSTAASTSSSPARLAWHTAEAHGSVAVRARGRDLVHEFDPGGQHAPALLAAIQDLLRAAGLGLADLGSVAVTTGPGSFTGIRVGLATAQGLAAARGWRVCTADSLQAQAWACGVSEAGSLAIVQDARRGEVYASRYAWRSGRPQVEVPPFCAAPAAARRLAAGLAPGERLDIAGSGAALIEEALRSAGVETQRRGAVMPVARALLDLADAGDGAWVDAAALDPLYLRKSDAELRKQDATS